MSNGVHKASIKSEGKFHLELALNLALEDYRGPGPHRKPGAISHWKVADGALVFGWHSSMKDSVPLPAPMGKDALIGLVLGWLEGAQYPEEPDHDGDNHKGWHLSTVGYEDFYATFKVEPYWVEYGK